MDRPRASVVKVDDDLPLILDIDYDEMTVNQLQKYDEARYQLDCEAKRLMLACWTEVHGLEAVEQDRREQERIATVIADGLETMKKEQTAWQEAEYARINEMLQSWKPEPVVPRVFHTSDDLTEPQKEKEKLGGFDINSLLERNKRRLKVLDGMMHR